MKHKSHGPVPGTPRRDCPVCNGTGWVESAQPPIVPLGADPKSYSRPMVRCTCPSPRDEQRPEIPSLDRARRAAGERDDA